MKILAITSRVEKHDQYQEIRDSLDQQLINFLSYCGYSSFILPNNVQNTKSLLEKITIDGIILSGGNDLFDYGGISKERDENEIFLLEYAISTSIPLLGICRGMQIIQHYFGIKLFSIQNHIRLSHRITYNGKKIWVNSFHNWGTDKEDKEIKTLAKTEDGIIEALKHTQYNVNGIMWHPERNSKFQQNDIKLIKKLFK